MPETSYDDEPAAHSTEADRQVAQKALLSKKYCGALILIHGGRTVEHGLDHSAIAAKSKEYRGKGVLIQYVPRLDEFAPPFIY